MNLLAIDTATERCSVAARVHGEWFERSADTQRGHADIVLTMVDEVLKESGVGLRELAGIAYGRGPGAFTGVRIAIGVVQGLAFGADLPTVGVSNLAAVACQADSTRGHILACMDARMNEVYWGVYAPGEAGRPLRLIGAEHVGPSEKIDVRPESIAVLAGTGTAAYPDLARRFASAATLVVLPRAREILSLGEYELRAGHGVSALAAQPVYLRDQVAFVKTG